MERRIIVAGRTVLAFALVAVTSACSPRNDAPAAVAEPPGVGPVWEDLPTQVAGCTVQRLANARELELFHWQPCAGAAECSEAVWNRDITRSDGEIGRRTVVDDDGDKVHVGVRWDSDAAREAGVVVTTEAGAVELALRLRTDGTCSMNIPSVAHGRFAVLVARSASADGPARKGGLLASLADLATLTPFEVDPLPAGTGPDEVAMGESRWLWRLAPDQLATFSNVDGAGVTVFAESSPTIQLLGGPAANGGSFLFDVIERAENGDVEAYIGRSDGIDPPERFVDGSPDAWVGAPMFAHSHIGWQKGLAPERINEFAAVELWAAPATEDPAELQPYKVADLPSTSWSWIGAGWGRYVTLDEPPGADRQALAIWDLAAKTSASIVLPADRRLEVCAGVTRSAVWIVPELATSPDRGLLRFAIDP